jgi:hypothetical protein
MEDNMHKASLGLLVVAALTGSAAIADGKPPKLSEREARNLSRALEGKQPGPPTSCVRMGLGSDGLRAISDEVLIYKIDSKLTYRNDVSGRCSGLSSGGALLLKPTNNQYCRGDIAQVLDLSSRIPIGSCALGDFVPYRTPTPAPAG